ncbi:hypothetical protein IW261DRAFT_1574624 [Armillaria novae-zelandiae]|uniref:Uncharacterized protein n=1 Tax=Armillaria novae-zelandiae TaxID=153914 RepID=A0AA39TQ09_9AGAR|nr:hypothetical protein IW261DRAFT_1574624 [Armillaria novae-zelandiae]
MTAQFRMMSGDLNLRTLYVSILEQQAITFLYLDLNGVSTKYNELPMNQDWTSGIRSEIVLECRSTEYGYNADFFDGWESGILHQQNTTDEITMGNLAMLHGTNPVQALCYEEYPATSTLAIVGSKYVSTEEGIAPSGSAEVVVVAGTADGGGIMADVSCIWGGSMRGVWRVSEVF